MTDLRALERLRSANPIPGLDHVDAEEYGLFVSHFEERRDAMTDLRTQQRRETAPKPSRRFHPAVVFAAALVVCLVIVGVAALFMRGDGDSVEPAAETTVPDVTTTVPEATTLPEAPPPEEPETPLPSADAIVARLSDEPEALADVAVGPDGLPIVASFRDEDGDYVGTIRLYRCEDASCTDVEAIDVMEERWTGYLEVTAAPNGDVYVNTEDLWLYSDGEATVLPQIFAWPWQRVLSSTQVSFTVDGRPMFVGPVGDQTVTLVVCDDAACASYTEVPIETGDFLQLEQPLVAGDDILVVYSFGLPTGSPDPEAGYDGADTIRTTKIATISNVDSAPTVEIETASEGLNEIPSRAAIDADGTVRVWLYSWNDEGPRYSLVSCNGTGCTSQETLGIGLALPQAGTLDAALTPDLRPIAAVAETVYDPDAYAAYLAEEERIAEAGLDAAAEEPEPIGTNIVVVECVDEVCSAVERSSIAVVEGAWYLSSLSLEVAPDGTVYVIIGSDVGYEGGGDAGLWLREFPAGTLGDLVEPFVGTVGG